ncbi:MAG: hypothetical protein JO215_12905 [Ktedonobacteraceae bacterium]|nr:hypothetical protein [Ktedonobacteraceae bacterium]
MDANVSDLADARQRIANQHIQYTHSSDAGSKYVNKTMGPRRHCQRGPPS